MTQPGSWAEGFTWEEIVPFNVWSASLPLTWLSVTAAPSVGPWDERARYRPWTLAPELVRPWNGRPLTTREVDGCFRAFTREYDLSCSVGGAVQAAYEWLSENVW